MYITVYKHLAEPGIEPGTPATPGLSRPISPVHIAPTTTTGLNIE